MLIITPATRRDVHKISPFIRTADRQEIAAATGHKVWDILLLSFDISDRCWTIRSSADSDPFVLFGVGNGGAIKQGRAQYKAGVVWMVATDEIKKHRVAFPRISRHLATMAMEGYDILFNYVWSGNWLHKRWLAWAGFTVLPPTPRGPFDELFHPFYLRKKSCVNPPPSL